MALFLLLVPWVVSGQNVGGVELTPTVGFWLGDTIARGVTRTFNFDVTVDDAPAYGLRLGYRFAPNWALDFALFREEADLVTGRRDLFGGRSKIGDIDLTTFEVGVEGSFGHRRVVPFLAGGVGAMHLDPNFRDASADTRFAANFGGGFKVFFTPELALRFDWRGHSVRVGEDHHDCDWWDECDRRDEWITFTEVSLGLSFVF
ncbi:MAG: outer membrane beta-barrel protein [Thermoanaerobaculum sp.]|nr:outer membrane beta-barrel protein [Thermoanaerobaculum sp.]